METNKNERKLVSVNFGGFFLSLLQIALIILKIIGYDLTWWQVFIPCYISIGLVLLFIISYILLVFRK